MGLIEQWGSGIPGIFSAARRLKMPEPKIIEIGMRMRVTVYLADPIPTRRPIAGTGIESGARSGAQSGAQSLEVLLSLSVAPQSAAGLVSALGLKSKTGAFKRTVRELLEQELIAYTLPDTPSSRLQKYRLTDKGREVLAMEQLTKQGKE